ncbi:hypothetical protein ABEF95_002163 [Exophiala dermatitidis]
MASVGPQLPPELQNRKRSHEDDDSESSDSSTGPLPPKNQEKDQSPPSAKRKRIYGPTLPPAPLEEEQNSPPSPPGQPQKDQEDDKPGHSSSSDDDDDDEFGPSLPSANDRSSASARPTTSSIPSASVSGTGAGPVQRDEWMTLAPTGGDWSARVDPTKLKNRKFNTGRGAMGPPQTAGGGAGTSSSWYETPEEKQARLRREVMGISNDAATAAAGGKSTASAAAGTHGDDAETARRLKKYNEKRGPSLYASHNASSKVVEEDDPSARAFDREKDIAGGATINATKRREMLKKASDFSSRFSSAKYL